MQIEKPIFLHNNPWASTPCGQTRSTLMTLVSSSSILYLSNSLVSTPSVSHAEYIDISFHLQDPLKSQESQVHSRKVHPVAPVKPGLSPAEENLPINLIFNHILSSGRRPGWTSVILVMLLWSAIRE